ncbi:MAG: GatB/YqeY domain-containing protein [Pseudomonadales bacterium]|nr:GatB/YqeY domain-containing protein [Pseudomonadales bacterium]MCP5185411.1 GatB/YqeY domain-containing protein [Pseudomonadales bacterium]
MTTLTERIAEATKVAMKAREREQVAALRLITAEIRRVEIDKRVTLDDAGVVTVLTRMVKQRHDSIAQYRQAGREELAAAEQFELDVIANFLPQPLTEAEIAELVRAAVAGESGMQAMGKVMASLKPQIEGRADMGKVSALVKQALSN